MNIFGVGGPELMVILIIMLVFAGPKRMIHWSYILGTYLAKFRVMWAQTVDLVQKEFDDAGVDIKLPKQPPTRQNINKAISDAFEPMTKPIQESLDEVKHDVESIKEVSKDYKEKTTEKLDTKTKTITQPVRIHSTKPVSDNANPETPVATEASPSSEPKPVNSTSPSLGTWSASSADK